MKREREIKEKKVGHEIKFTQTQTFYNPDQTDKCSNIFQVSSCRCDGKYSYRMAASHLKQFFQSNLKCL